MSVPKITSAPRVHAALRKAYFLLPLIRSRVRIYFRPKSLHPSQPLVGLFYYTCRRPNPLLQPPFCPPLPAYSFRSNQWLSKHDQHQDFHSQIRSSTPLTQHSLLRRQSWNRCRRHTHRLPSSRYGIYHPLQTQTQTQTEKH